MNVHRLTGIDGSDPLGYLAALGLLRCLARERPEVSLAWVHDGVWRPELSTPDPRPLIAQLDSELERWRGAPAPVAFAVDADRKPQDLKHPPADFRALMRASVASGDREFADFVASYASGVIVDGSGQTKPTSLHFNAGQQRFMDGVLDVLSRVTTEDLDGALFGPWAGRSEVKDLRWRSGGERSRALLSFDPSKEKVQGVVGANWLAFQALPIFVVGPTSKGLRTTGFVGKPKSETFTWCLWGPSAQVAAVATLVRQAGLADLDAAERRGRGIVEVFESRIVRSEQGYGSFAPPRVV